MSIPHEEKEERSKELQQCFILCLVYQLIILVPQSLLGQLHLVCRALNPVIEYNFGRVYLLVTVLVALVRNPLTKFSRREFVQDGELCSWSPN